ncbi:fimbrial protein [Providencia vermicola]|uniref:fimbrial protein n=1 Tax=Providencia vermicola TaxID=333965 RepID=UPI002AB3624E|nr:fimbrial protein [Providencia stuartii]
MFKKTLLALSLVTLSGAALSAPVANLKVDGTITPPTCTVNGSDSTDVLYTFDVAPGVFPASGNLIMDDQVKNIEVICDATTYLAFDITDMRADSPQTPSQGYFGLGFFGENTKVGFYTITMQNATIKADKDAEARTAYVKVGTASEASQLINSTYKTAWANTSGTSAVPVAAQVFAADFAVKPRLNGLLKNSDGSAKLDGHAIMTFSFGV